MSSLKFFHRLISIVPNGSILVFFPGPLKNQFEIETLVRLGGKRDEIDFRNELLIHPGFLTLIIRKSITFN